MLLLLLITTPVLLEERNSEYPKVALRARAEERSSDDKMFRGRSNINDGNDFDDGIHAYSKGFYSVALTRFKKHVALHPKDPAGHNNVAEALMKQRKYEEALPSMLKATELEPDNHEYWFNLGVLYGHLKMGDKARAAYDEAVKHTNRKYDASWANH